jgi:hypothetical protein
VGHLGQFGDDINKNAPTRSSDNWVNPAVSREELPLRLSPGVP